MLRGVVLIVSFLIGAGGAARQDLGNPKSTASVQGTIFSSGYGTSIEGARINMADRVHEVYAISDAEGRYQIDSIPAGKYEVTVNCPGFATYRSEVMLSPGRVRLSIALDVGLQDDPGSGVLIRGVVSGPGHEPLEGASVVVASPFNKAIIQRVSTSADGRYSIRLPWPGQYVVYASKEGFKAVARILVADGQGTDSDFSLPVFSIK
jgi:hypothetical protein